MKLKAIMILCLLLILGGGYWFAQSDSHLLLPKDFYDPKGEVIHPFCMPMNLASLEEAEPFYPIACDEAKKVPGSLLEEDIQIDPTAKEVREKIRYELKGEEGERYESIIHQAYTYLYSYDGKYLIFVDYHEEGATGYFTHLTLIRRVGDQIEWLGDLAGGDRGYGGEMMWISGEGNLVRFQQIKQDQILFYEVNLDDPHLEKKLYKSLENKEVFCAH